MEEKLDEILEEVECARSDLTSVVYALELINNSEDINSDQKKAVLDMAEERSKKVMQNLIGIILRERK